MQPAALHVGAAMAKRTCPGEADDGDSRVRRKTHAMVRMADERAQCALRMAREASWHEDVPVLKAARSGTRAPDSGTAGGRSKATWPENREVACFEQHTGVS